MKMPLRYVCEMVCDRVAASQIYLGDRVHRRLPVEYYERSKTTTCSTPRPGRCWKSCCRWCATSGRTAPLPT